MKIKSVAFLTSVLYPTDPSALIDIVWFYKNNEELGDA